VTVEDGTRFGGAGAFMADAIATHCSAEGVPAPTVVVLGTPVAYIPQSRAACIHAELGLDGPGIARSARAAVDAPAIPSA
ncbi:MAG: 1-deoxy-D-xylulose-5-phosphate synthase, partial [Acidimicrobiales bacterium]